MSSVPTREAFERAIIQRVLGEVGLSADYETEISSRLEDPDGSWRSCCGGFCDPCALVIARAVDRVLSELQRVRTDAQR